MATVIGIFEDQYLKKKPLTVVTPGSQTRRFTHIFDTVSICYEAFKKNKCKFILMHCVSTYPCPIEKLNLNMIITLRNKFKCEVGYSGHETGLTVSLAAAALGASSIERHITLDRAMYGSDQAASLSPPGLKKLVPEVRKIELALGDGVKRILDEEIPIAKKLREHLK